MVEDDAQRVESRSVRGYRAATRVTYIIESLEWDVKDLERDRSALRVSSATSETFAIGMRRLKPDKWTWRIRCRISCVSE